jgi:hypothetical protein
VTVDISASNRIDPVVWRGTSSFRTAGGSPFPSRLSYAGKKMRITGTVEMVDAKADPSNYLTRIGMQMRTLRPAAGTNGWHYAMTYPAPDSIPLQDINGKQVSFDFTQTVPTDYYSNLGVIVFNNSLGGENALSANHFTLKWDIKYELLDQDDFKVEKIVLPTGKEVLSDRYTDTLTSDGTYTYKVHDSRGKITERSVSVKIDKVAPSLNLSASTTATTHSNIVLTARGADALSGVKRIQLPNNEWVDAATATYNVGTNGTYTFMVEDNAGNTLSRSVTVSNIDKSVSITSPTVGSFGSTVLTDSAQELFTTVSLITVKDWSEGANYWRLEASATRMSTAAGDMLPVGSLSVAPLSSVSKAAGGSGGTPSVVANGWQVMDGSSPARLAVSNGSRGEHTAVFPTKALKLTLDPATARHGTYSATVRWELVRAP